jgi:hypothetical protein
MQVGYYIHSQYIFIDPLKPMVKGKVDIHIFPEPPEKKNPYISVDRLVNMVEDKLVFTDFDARLSGY